MGNGAANHNRETTSKRVRYQSVYLLPVMTIRQATINDAAGIAKVLVDCWHTTYRGVVSDEYLSRLNYEDRTSRWQAMLAKSSAGVFVAEADNGIVGYASCGATREANEFQGELYAIYILQEHQRRGIGKLLFDKVVSYLLSYNMPSMMVCVLKDNPANAFYDKMGGVLVQEQSIPIGKQTLPALIYGWRELTNINLSSRP